MEQAWRRARPLLVIWTVTQSSLLLKDKCHVNLLTHKSKNLSWPQWKESVLSKHCVVIGWVTGPPPPDPQDYIKHHQSISEVRGMWLSNRPLDPKHKLAWHTLTCSQSSIYTKRTSKQAGTHVSHYGWFLREISWKVRAWQWKDVCVVGGSSALWLLVIEN